MLSSCSQEVHPGEVKLTLTQASEREMESYTHIAMIPLPAMGHQTPMMRLACRLASMGEIRITFFTTDWFMESALASREQAYQQLVHVVSLSRGSVEAKDMKGSQSAVAKMIEATGEMEPLLEKSLREFLDRGERLDCLVSEAFFNWPQRVADRLGIPRVGFWPSSTPVTIPVFLTSKLITEDYVPVQEKLATRGNVPVEGMPGMSSLRLADIPFSFYEPDVAGIQLHAEHGGMMNQASCILFSSFAELDKELLEAVQRLLSIPCLPVGPLLPNAFLDEDKLQQLPKFNFGETKEDTTCLSWLDEQEPRSVVYISFGSLANLSISQLETLADGLERSDAKFLWVIRPSLVGRALSDSPKFQEFLGRTKNRGRIISWAPQLEVLAHKSTALFVTHCGWNSAMEGIWSGIPMLVWPCFADQNMNAKYIVHVWRIGAAFNEDTMVHPGAFVSSEEVERTIRESMVDDALLKRMAHASSAAKSAGRRGGSSYRNMEKFVQAVRTVGAKPGVRLDSLAG